VGRPTGVSNSCQFRCYSVDTNLFPVRVHIDKCWKRPRAKSLLSSSLRREGGTGSIKAYSAGVMLEMQTRNARSGCCIFGLLCLILICVACRTPNRVDFSDPLLNQRRVLLFGAIDDGKAELTIQRLLYLDGKTNTPIDLFLQTPGGQFKGALAIEQTMRSLRSPVNTYALSECNSGGALLLAAGTGKRRAFEGAVIMVHGLRIDPLAPKSFVELMRNSYEAFWRERAQLPDGWLPFAEGTNHFFSAEQALEYRLVDEVVKR
jgi:ATP-dependent Clp protease protease subunit